MAKERVIDKVVTKPFSAILKVAVWLTSILVSLAVGFGMADGTLSIRWINTIGFPLVTVIAGWIVIVLTIISVVLAILDRV